jgi:hypothetical protein
MTYKKADFNTEIKSVVLSGHAGVIWMISNPATGNTSYQLEVDDGEFVESKSFDHILDVFNKRGKK